MRPVATLVSVACTAGSLNPVRKGEPDVENFRTGPLRHDARSNNA